MIELRLGRSIAQILPLHRIPISIMKQEEKGIITTKLVITMAVIAMVKISILLLWI